MDNMLELIESVKKLGIGKLVPELQPWSKSHLKTGLVYDDFMIKHDCPWIKPDECPQRYERIRDRILELGLVDQCQRIDSKIAKPEQILLVHDEKYFKVVESTKGEKDIDKLKAVSEKYDGIYFNEHTFDVAMMAAGSAIALTDEVIEGRTIKNGFALIRTPGHHAQYSEANGYCYFNNAAIVAKHCITKHNMSKILIIDWDVHHGQGTQSLFYDNPDVVYVSIHRYERGKFWPELIESNFNFTGLNKGKGFNINVPLNETGCNDADFLLMWFGLILPMAYEFNPELVIISAGYDAAIGCPEGKMRVKPLTYHILCHSLQSLADGRVVALLEGGYNLNSLAEGAAHTLRSLIGYPCPKIDDRFIEMIPHKSLIQTLLDTTWAIRPKWKFLQLQGSFERFKPEDSSSSPGGDADQRQKYCPVATYEGSIYEVKPEKYDVDGVSCPKDELEQARLNREIETITKLTDLTTPSKYLKERTLLIFDDEMTLHKCSDKTHPEKPQRYTRIKKRLQETGLIDRCTLGTPRVATVEELLLAHNKPLIELMESTQKMTKKELTQTSSKLDSIYMNESTYKCALLAAGCTLEAIDRVMTKQNANAFALIRPPGHHADRDEPSGFCFFNNVVVGAFHALKQYPDTCKRVLIVDYDVHHGNGIQKIVQDNDQILYISLHSYNDAACYPMIQLSNFTTGSKNIINIPWNDDPMGDSEYMMAFFSIVLPIAYEFNPDLVLVSSGFDAAINDPLGGYKVSPSTYGHFIHHLLPLAGGRLVACLEGGYNLDSISESAAHVVSVLLGDPPKSLSLKAPSKSAIISMKNVISYHKSNYNMLCLDYDLPSDEVD